MPLYLPLANPTEDDEVLRIDFDYYEHRVKERQGLYLSACPGKTEVDEGTGWKSWVCMPLRSGRFHYQQMDRRNARTNQSCWVGIKASIEQRTGKAWDFIVEYCAKVGLELAEKEQAVTV